MAREHEHVLAGPNRKRARKAVRVIGAALAAVVLLLLLLCHFLGIHSKMDVIAYRAMAREHCHPIWKDLALHRIKKGDDLEKLLENHPPTVREDFGPYAHLSYSRGSSAELVVIAKDGRLIGAQAGSRAWRHTFFATPEEEKAFARAFGKHVEQAQLETDAYKIHRAITGGQDVFLSQHVERREVPGTAPDAAGMDEMMKQLKEIYGDRYIQSVGMTRGELTVEVNEVLYGDLEPGTILNFPADECDEAELREPQTVFLHFEDGGMMPPHAQGQALYLTVPRSALEWYRSLTPEQIQELETRRSTG